MPCLILLELFFKYNSFATIWLKPKEEGVVVGMSGGVDSSVTAVLCQRAFPQTTLGVIMPCYSDKLDEIQAKLIAGKFGIATTKIVLDEVFDVLLGNLMKGEVRELAVYHGK